MRISFHPTALKRTKVSESVQRFLFGGIVTVLTGLVAEHFGPVVGGLFLAFPAIFPASATLIEKHETEKKKRAGIVRTNRGRQVAAVDAAGAALGSVGLAAFAVCAWKLLPNYNGFAALAAASLGWLLISVAAWLLRTAHWWR